MHINSNIQPVPNWFGNFWVSYFMRNTGDCYWSKYSWALKDKVNTALKIILIIPTRKHSTGRVFLMISREGKGNLKTHSGHERFRSSASRPPMMLSRDKMTNWNAGFPLFYSAMTEGISREGFKKTSWLF